MSLKAQKAKTWKAFSRYIRHKYSDGDNCECFTCGCVRPIKEMQAGHGISGRTTSILFLEEIVRPQCVACNMFKAGMYEVFIPKLIDLYGREGYEEFVRMKHQPRKFTVEELKEMEDEWTTWLKQNKH